jgi:prepilin-type N-terminal cleavage/methylation domain-containing protein
MRTLERTRRSDRQRRGFTLIELAIVVIVLGILLSIAVGSLSGTERGGLDAAGMPTLGAAQVDARRVANLNGFTYPPAAQLADQLTSVTASTNGTRLTYQAGQPSPDSRTVSVARRDVNTIGAAVMTSTGSGADGHCLLMIDSLRTGARYAKLTDALAGGTNHCDGAFVLACDTVLAGLPGDGSADHPYALPASTVCP